MIGVIDYGAGNQSSVGNALTFLGAPFRVVRSGADFSGLDKLILPGVGFFGDCVNALHRQGVWEPLNEAVVRRKVPFLGICLGFQLLALGSEESPAVPGLGWIDGRVVLLKDAQAQGLSVPHVGWNSVRIENPGRLFQGFEDEGSFYFVHSYGLQLNPPDQAARAGTCVYGAPFVAAVEKDNIFGVQFHPEKSQKEGLRLLTNFIELHG